MKRTTYYQGDVENSDGINIVEKYLNDMKHSGNTFSGIDLEIINKILKKNENK